MKELDVKGILFEIMKAIREIDSIPDAVAQSFVSKMQSTLEDWNLEYLKMKDKINVLSDMVFDLVVRVEGLEDA